MQACSTRAITHRMAHAQKTHRQWQSLLCCPWISTPRRIELLSTSVWPSFLWGAACWHSTKAMTKKICRGGARMTAKTAGVCRATEEPNGSWWRIFHREGHRLTASLGVNPESARRRSLHRWAGQVVRTACTGEQRTPTPETGKHFHICTTGLVLRLRMGLWTWYCVQLTQWP